MPLALCRLPMRVRLTAIIGLLLLILTGARPGAAQEISPLAGGLEAFFAGDSERATRLLKTHVFNADEPDPWALYALGLMHQSGRGVSQDRVLACAYFNLAATLFAHQSGDDSPYSQISRRAFDASCASLAADDVAEMNRLMACPHEGPPAAVETLSPRQWVVVERTRWRVAYEGEESVYPIILPGCRSVVLPVGHTELAGPGVPPGDPRERRFLQYFVWVPGRVEGRIARQLFWIVDEIRENRMSRAVLEPVLIVDDASYPDAQSPELDQLVQLSLTPSGEIAWAIASEPPRTGLIPIPGDSARPVSSESPPEKP